jgi:hypothetical protein
LRYYNATIFCTHSLSLILFCIRRYAVANANGIPAPVVSFFVSVLPDRVFDAVLGYY